jgi:hypothetical protein
MPAQGKPVHRGKRIRKIGKGFTLHHPNGRVFKTTLVARYAYSGKSFAVIRYF